VANHSISSNETVFSSVDFGVYMSDSVSALRPIGLHDNYLEKYCSQFN